MAIRTAIIGYGRSGSTLHAGPLEKNPAFRVAAVCDIEAAPRRDAAARFGCPVYADYREMLRREALDLAVVVTRTDQHAAMACDYLAAGVNVLVTKPWAVDAAEARGLMATARAAGRRLLPWLPARWGCDLSRLQELVSAGAVGRVFFIRRTAASFATRCDWQTERRFGGGYLLNWGPHLVDPPVLLAGSPVASVYARLRQVLNPGDGEDLFAACLTLEDGTLVQAEYTIAASPWPSWVVQGDRGTIVMNGRALTLYQRAPARPVDPTAFPAMQGKAAPPLEETVSGALYGDEHAIYREIAASFTGGAPYRVTPDEAYAVTRVLDAIRTAAVENRVVTL